jgi:trimeric autotransporter adhesin
VNKKLLVNAIAAASLSLTLVACGDSDSSSDTTPAAVNVTAATAAPAVATVVAPTEIVTQQDAPVGTVVGYVQDTNGNPVEGASVYIGGQVTTTDAGGMYAFDDVAVSQLVANDLSGTSANSNMFHQEIQIRINPPSGYLGALVSVSPNATTETVSAIDNSVVTFMNGFHAVAGIAELPMTNAEVKGVLRDTDTGEALPNVVLKFDITDILDNHGDIETNIDTSYDTSGLMVTTNENGEFYLNNLPTDTDLRILLDDYVVTSDDDFETFDSIELINLEVVEVRMLNNSDSVDPYIIEVEEVDMHTSATGEFNDDTNQTFNIKFSEPMDTTMVDGSDNSIFIFNKSQDYAQVPFTHAFTDSETLEIALTSALAAGDEIDVWLLKNDFRDLAMDRNMLGTETGSGANTTIGYDYDSMAANASFVRLDLRTWMNPNLTAELIDLTNAQKDVDAMGMDDHAIVQANSNSLMDVSDSETGIQQLNSGEDDDSNGNDAESRLSDYATAVSVDAGWGAISVETDVARLEFVSGTASKYNISVAAADGTARISNYAFSGGSTNSAVLTTSTDFTASAAGETIYVVVDNVMPGDIVTIIPFNDFGYPGAMTTVVLVDNVKPVPVLQNSYGAPDNDTSGDVTSITYGNGGEQAQNGDQTVGIPVVKLTPRLLSNVDGSMPSNQDEKEAVYSLNALFDMNTVNAIDGDANEGEMFIDELALNGSNLTQAGAVLSSNTSGVYDANAIAAYLLSSEVKRTIGVAMSEDVTLVTQPDADFTLSSGTVFVEQNDTVMQDDGGMAINVDLVNFTIDNVVALANDNDGAEIDFTDDIEDNAGNVADAATNAKVALMDYLPPLVLTAVYNGEMMLIEFNENIMVNADDAMVVTVGGVAITLDDSSEFMVSGKTLTIYKAAWGDNLAIATVFGLAQYDEADAATAETDAILNLHASFDFGEIEDANGNNWNNYNDATEEYFMQKPMFAMVNALSSFTVSETDSSATNTFSATYTSNHAIDISVIDTSANGIYEDAEIIAAFNVTLATAVLTSGHTLTMNADSTVVTVTFMLDTDAATADALTPVLNWMSDYDSSQTVSAANTTITK